MNAKANTAIFPEINFIKYPYINNFVKEQGDTIVGNPILTAKLLDEYFDEFAEHHIIPSEYMMDNFGHYKLVDYIDLLYKSSQ